MCESYLVELKKSLFSVALTLGYFCQEIIISFDTEIKSRETFLSNSLKKKKPHLNLSVHIILQ